MPSYGGGARTRQALVNLLTNAIKFTRDDPAAVIQIGSMSQIDPGKPITYYVRDGTGFDTQYYDKVFAIFQRLHSNA